MRIFRAFNMDEYEYVTFYVGATAEIKTLYKSIARNRNTLIVPLFGRNARFNPQRLTYALCIDEFNHMTVINSDVMLEILLNGEYKGYELYEVKA